MNGGDIFYLSAIFLMVMGVFIALSGKHLIKILLGIDVFDTGLNLLIVSFGYVKGATAPIFSRYPHLFKNVVDPVPQALVLTAIVIGVAEMAMGLAIVMKIKEKFGTCNVNKLKELKW